MMNFVLVLKKSFRDILSPTVLGFILKVGLGSFLFWSVILSLFWEPFERFIASYLAMIPWVGSWSWFQESGAFLAALVVGYALVIVTISILSSLFGEKVILKLAAQEYPELRPVEGGGKIHRSIYYTLKASLIFFLLFFLTLPLIFIPLFGQFWMLWLWSILLREPTIYDVGSLFIAEEKEIWRRGRRVRLIALVAALFNYLPLLNIFAPLFAQILFMHDLLGRRSVEP